jgi:hypothetical protein
MTATITAATGTSQPLFVVFAGLLARVQRPACTERRLTGSIGLATDRDHRLLADLGSLPGVPVDLARLASL